MLGPGVELPQEVHCRRRLGVAPAVVLAAAVLGRERRQADGDVLARPRPHPLDARARLEDGALARLHHRHASGVLEAHRALEHQHVLVEGRALGRLGRRAPHLADAGREGRRVGRDVADVLGDGQVRRVYDCHGLDDAHRRHDFLYLGRVAIGFAPAQSMCLQSKRNERAVFGSKRPAVNGGV